MITCPYCLFRAHVTYKTGSAHRVSQDPEVITGAYTCDECRRMLSATAEVDLSHDRKRGSSDDHYLWVRGLERVIDGAEWQPKSVLGKTFLDIPEHIAKPASEAFECFSIGAYRASVLMARSVIEASAKEMGVTSGNLVTKIDKLAEQGDIRTLLADAAHEVRLTGNDMAHGDFATTEITLEDADDLLGLMEDFLREIFELPTRIERRQRKNRSIQEEARQSSE